MYINYFYTFFDKNITVLYFGLKHPKYEDYVRLKSERIRVESSGLKMKLVFAKDLKTYALK